MWGDAVKDENTNVCGYKNKLTMNISFVKDDYSYINNIIKEFWKDIFTNIDGHILRPVDSFTNEGFQNEDKKNYVLTIQFHDENTLDKLKPLIFFFIKNLRENIKKETGNDIIIDNVKLNDHQIDDEDGYDEDGDYEEEEYKKEYSSVLIILLVVATVLLGILLYLYSQGMLTNIFS